MAKEAEDLGANAVAGARLTTSQTTANAVEILTYEQPARLDLQSKTESQIQGSVQASQVVPRCKIRERDNEERCFSK